MADVSLLELTDEARASVDLIVVIEAVDMGVLRFVDIAGYAGGREGRKVFGDRVEFAGDTLDDITPGRVQAFAVESLRDGGIILNDPVWTEEVGGFEYHAKL
jgi:hypothetical protein